MNEGTAQSPGLRIRAMESIEDAQAFRRLNEEWITRWFALEKKDQDTLQDPKRTILDVGGHIFVVERGHALVGCAALLPFGDGVFEVSKMAVSPECRGLGIGRKLLDHTIQQAKRLGATSLFLGSSTKLQNAVHLYESAGFRHVSREELPPMPYARADVFMKLEFEKNGAAAID